MAPSSPISDAPRSIVFRGKKRKTYRQRSGTEPDAENDASTMAVDPVLDAPNVVNTQDPTPDTVAASADKGHDEVLSISDALRFRHSRRPRLRGVTFGVDHSIQAGSTQADDELSQMIREEEKKAIEQSITTANRRFAPQTGLSGEMVNRHMEEYIEAELAKRHHAASNPQMPRISNQPGGSTTHNGSIIRKGEQKHTALTGKLLEVDLGDEVRNRNAALTDRATRKLQGLAVEDEESTDHPKKVRLGRDGKPWRPRNKRNSDDIKRDQLVEEILQENKLDVYDTPAQPSGPDAAEDEVTAADDRIAEEFRREFLDAMAERHRRRRRHAAHPNKPGTKKDEDVLKGPKLGGSRNTRAAMRDLLLKKEKEKEKR